jgi:hypothetical protein
MESRGVDSNEVPNDAILPRQFFELVHQSSERPPEVRLWIEVLYKAIEDLRPSNASNKLSINVALRRAQQAKEWIQSDQEYPGSFRWICSVFDLHPNLVPNQLLAFAETGDRMRPQRRSVAHNGARPCADRPRPPRRAAVTA